MHIHLNWRSTRRHSHKACLRLLRGERNGNLVGRKTLLVGSPSQRVALLPGQGGLQPRRGLRGHVARRAIVGRRARFSRLPHLPHLPHHLARFFASSPPRPSTALCPVSCSVYRCVARFEKGHRPKAVVHRGRVGVLRTIAPIYTRLSPLP
eukprot:COSAG02_NODE_3582_length_6531_cov_4.696206_2_plen_151_part_00